MTLEELDQEIASLQAQRDTVREALQSAWKRRDAYIHEGNVRADIDTLRQKYGDAVVAGIEQQILAGGAVAARSG